MPPPHSWFDGLRDLALACSGSFAEEEARRLREAFALLQAAPSADLLAGIDLPDSASFEFLVHAGAAESAALMLIGPEAGFMLSRGPEGRFLASVFLPGRLEESSAGAETAALALLAALAVGLQDAAMSPGEWSDLPDRPALRLN
ncbi:MAG: hypothetical protein ACKOPO_14655 [Novosphingobium sp.]